MEKIKNRRIVKVLVVAVVVICLGLIVLELVTNISDVLNIFKAN